MAKVPLAYQRVLAEHRRRVEKLSGGQGLSSLRKIYDQAILELERRLKRLPGAKRNTFTAHQHRLFLGQLRQGLALLMKRMAGGMGDISKSAQNAALRGLIGDISRLEGAFTGAEVVLPLEEAARFQGVISGVRESLLRTHEVSAARYGARLISKMEDQLTMGLSLGEDIGSAIDRVVQAADLEWWQAERITRTETLWAYNATHQSGMKEAAEALPDLMMRWTERVGDAPARGLDDRVDVDSIAMHGQVAPPGGVFRFPSMLPRGAQLTMDQRKNWPKVQARFAGQTWAHPPNRPNDRSSLAPWRPHWGIPAWHLVNGRRVQLG